jgi:carbonic anhydrase
MKMKATTWLLATTILLAGHTYDCSAAAKSGKDQSSAVLQEHDETEKATMKQFLTDLFKYNKKFANSYNSKESEGYLKQQTPTATLVLCSDSRVSTETFSDSDINNVFVIRNIGNQLDTAQGSVEYGVRHLHTKILVFIGHTGCGAVEASMGDTSGLSKTLRKELDPLEVKDDYSLNDNIVANVDNQVEKAHHKFKDLVKKGDLLILGALYDIHNKLGGGNHRVYISNVNGIKDDKIIGAEHWVKNIPNVKILATKYHKLK